MKPVLDSRLVAAVVVTFLLPACAPDAPPPLDIPTWAKVAPEQIAEAKKHGVPVAFENELGMRFVLIPAGTFLMGSPEDEEGRQDDETQHEVTISKPFYISIHEVTNADFRRMRPNHPYTVGLQRDAQPVVGVRWMGAAFYAEWMTERDENRTYRLPTEAEWEYACRAGTTGPYAWGDSDVEELRKADAQNPLGADVLERSGWPKTDGPWYTARVGAYPPNRWGLHEMHGNASEWCTTPYGRYPPGPLTDPLGPEVMPQSMWWPPLSEKPGGRGSRTAGPLFVVRGGSWRSTRVDIRSAKRSHQHANRTRPYALGFRLVSPLPNKAE